MSEILRPCAADLERLARDFLRRSGVPGMSIGIVHDQQLVWSWSGGRTRFDDGHEPDERTLYQIASITKTFTATAVLQLRDEGVLHLDDPLVRHVPEFAAAQAAPGAIELVTLRHLLHHSSGLQGEVPNRDLRVWTLLPMGDLLASLREVRIAIPPATRVKYSNLGFRLLAEVVRRAGGREFWDHVREAILDPLAMGDTTHDPAGNRAAQGHQARAFDDRPAPEPHIGADVQVGAGGLWSSVRDLARWLAQQFRTGDQQQRGPGQVLTGTTLLEMQRAVVVEDAALTAARGLGWSIIRDGDTVLVGHAGHVAGFTSDLRFCTADRVGAIVLANGTAVAVPLWELTPRLLEVARPHVEIAGLRSAGAPAPTPPAWSELLGGYRASGGSFDARVEARDGTLVLFADAADAVRLEPTSDPLCFIALDGRPAGETVRFFRGDDGTVHGVNIAGFPLTRLRPAFEARRDTTAPVAGGE